MPVARFRFYAELNDFLSQDRRFERPVPGRVERAQVGEEPFDRQAARREFQSLLACPATGKPTAACAGCAVDLIIPLKRGRLDTPSDMRRQTIAEAKAKERVE